MITSTGLVSIVIPTRNRKEKLRRCIDSVFKSKYANIEVIIVDDCGDYDIAEIGVEFPSVKILRNQRRMLLSYSRNRGVSYARGDYIFFLDDDNVIDSNAISELVKCAKANNVAVAAPVIYYCERPMEVWTYHIQKGRFPGFYVLHKQPPIVGLKTFAFHDAFLVKKDVFDSLGGFDHDVFPIHFSELDFAYRMQRKKYKATIVPLAKVWHDMGHEREHVDRIRAYYTLRNRVILMRRYASRRELVAYVFVILPVLTLYYLRRFMVHSSEGAMVTAFELSKGVIHGLACNHRFWEATSASAGSAAKSQTLVTLPKVSIIIPTMNSEATLKQCLESIIAQTYRNIEVIIVDNSSTDGTREIAKQYRFVKLFTAGPERSAQINFGVKMGAGDYVYRVDSDFVLEPTVVEEAVRACELANYDMVAVHNTSHPGISFWSRVRKLERDCYRDDTIHIAARFFKRSAFERVSGFDEGLVASEDYDLHRRLVEKGFRFGRIGAQEVHIGEPRSLREVVLKHVYYGKKINEFLSKYPREPFEQLSPIRMAYLHHWRDFLKDPRLLVGFFIYQGVRYTSAFFGYLVSIL